MSHYQAPLTDMHFNLFDLWQTQQFWQQQPALQESLDQDTASAILAEAAKVTSELISPYAKTADDQGVRLQDG
ncbi:MAG: acyl-CoA dehydrogenase N-terminal domain-containing protein, partial [Usitatibacteraceae bacterium]